MKIDDLITHTGEWLKGAGPQSHIVMSSRIRLARNVEKIPFPARANKKDLAEIVRIAKAAFDSSEYFKNAMLLKINELDALDQQFFIERHLMSHDHAATSEGRAILISKEEILSIMINEEDHLRIQVMQSGFDLRETWKIINMIDDILSAKIPYAYDANWGYLTACPTNTGTGIRGSVMLHLPALVMTKQINKVLEAIAKLSFTSRGFYGEGTQATGNFFQISNQVSLGHSEEDILQNINGLVRQIVEQEEQARQALLVQNRSVLEDKISRSYGILKSAHIISSQETVDLLSMVRLGIDVGVIKHVSKQTVNELFIMIQPAHLQKIEGKKLDPLERDVKRASVIREKLKA
ncbi:MAG TPA: protein arginine kinase [Candidatus Omnitrophota bacterium]|nr:protein arginine kinase [Candidatus Omnitrophota bacterium]